MFLRWLKGDKLVNDGGEPSNSEQFLVNHRKTDEASGVRPARLNNDKTASECQRLSLCHFVTACGRILGVHWFRAFFTQVIRDKHAFSSSA